jgi:energy-converting hydrogenase Eha subunit E
MHAQMNADPARPQTATGRSAAAAVYRERLSPSLWTLLSAAVAAPRVSLVFVPIDSTVALLAGLAVGAALVGSLVLAAPVIEVRGGELRVGRAHIPVGMLGEASGAVGDEAREVRGPGLPRTAWHLLRPGIDGIVRVRVIDERDRAIRGVHRADDPDVVGDRELPAAGDRYFLVAILEQVHELAEDAR